eukprot:7018463-Prymnesium_polylepis.1
MNEVFTMDDASESEPPPSHACPGFGRYLQQYGNESQGPHRAARSKVKPRTRILCCVSEHLSCHPKLRCQC